MEWQQFILSIFDNVEKELEIILQDLSPEELNRQPAQDANPVGWLAWHLTRSFDRNISELAGIEQLWISDEWYKQFGRDADPGETGFGHTPEQVAAFLVPDRQTMMSYHRAVQERIRAYITTMLSETELDRESYSPTFNRTIRARIRLLGVINDIQHLGQASYVRGLITEQGWLGK